jgi:hypothetical protein
MAHPIDACYAIVMSIRRITISVPARTAVRIKRAAGRMPVSAWVTGVIEERIEDVELERLWQEFYRSVRPLAADTKRADAIFRRLTKSPRGKPA